MLSERHYPIDAILVLLGAAGLNLPAGAQAGPAPESLRVDADQLFRIAEAAVAAGDLSTAERAYRSLTADPDFEKCTEARFRLALLLADRFGRVREGAALLRRVLDDKPDAVRVRLELARLHARLGNRSAAESELRAAQATGLPPDVERLVRFYRQSLNVKKRQGGSIEIALAPDSNINRATRSDTLGTVIGDFEIERAAKAKSGIGLTIRGQGYGWLPLSHASDLLLRVNAAANFYGGSQFDDISKGIEAGPEVRTGTSRMTFLAGINWRSYGRKPYSRIVGGSAAWEHPVGTRSQLRVDLAAGSRANFRNRLDEGVTYSASLALDRAFTATAGGGLQAYLAREEARHPGYATLVAGATVYAYREIGRTTVVLTGALSRLAADDTLPLFLRRRKDARLSASAAATFRSLAVRGFAPLVRFKWERNHSTLELYAYRRRAVEFGLTRAF